MKKSFKDSRSLWLCVYILIILVACKKNKDPDNNNTTKTKTELLTAGRWKYTGSIVFPAYDYYGDGRVTTDIFSIMKDCEKDDFELYKTNGTWEYNEGPTKCDPSYPQVFSLPWSFAGNETNLILGGVQHTIMELTATTLRLRYSFEDAGVIYTGEDSYEH